MFIIIALLTLACICYLSIRLWIRNHSYTSSSIQKILNEVSQLISLEKWDEAQNAILPLLHHPKSGAKAHLYYSQVLRGTHALDQALHCIRYASKHYPEELLLRLEEGKILLELGQPEEALKAFEVCAPILRTESDVLALARALLRGGYPEQCWSLIAKRLDKTKNEELISLAAETLSTLKKFAEAIYYYEYGIQLGFCNHYILGQLAHAYRRLGNLGQAEKIYRNLLEKDPGDVEATLGLGRSMEERGLYQKAFLIYQSNHAWEKKDRRLIKQAALCALNIRKYHYAEHYFQELAKAHDASPTTLSYYGYSLERQKKWDKAEQVYLNLIKKFPSQPNGYRGAAWLFGVGLTTAISNEQGLNFAHISLKLLNDSTSWEILSAVHARIGDFEKAYQIQEALLAQESDKLVRQRRQEALRHLRKNLPLEDQHVSCSLVA